MNLNERFGEHARQRISDSNPKCTGDHTYVFKFSESCTPRGPQSTAEKLKLYPDDCSSELSLSVGHKKK